MASPASRRRARRRRHGRSRPSRSHALRLASRRERADAPHLDLAWRAFTNEPLRPFPVARAIVDVNAFAARRQDFSGWIAVEIGHEQIVDDVQRIVYQLA